MVFGLSSIYGTAAPPAGLSITFKDGSSQTLNPTATPTHPMLSQDPTTGKIWVKDGSQAIVFCLEMVGVSYDANTYLFLDGSGNWAIANSKTTDPAYSWNSGTTPVSFIYDVNTKVYTYNNAAPSKNNAVLFTNGTHQNDTYTAYSYFDFSQAIHLPTRE